MSRKKYPSITRAAKSGQVIARSFLAPLRSFLSVARSLFVRVPAFLLEDFFPGKTCPTEPHSTGKGQGGCK